MTKEKNPWFPWVEPLKKKKLEKEGKLFVIIPTAGDNLDMIKSCLKSVRYAYPRNNLHIILVLSPSTKRKIEELKGLLGENEEVIFLRGKFNYCRSINQGLSHKDKEDKYALFLNDDVTFTRKGDILRMIKSLREEEWSCIGPFINYNPNRNDPTWPKEKSSAGRPRAKGAIRTNSPLSGSCFLWDIWWLDRIGRLDEGFGKGWGMDEADLCLRALRAGAKYGHEDSVAIDHIMHATFGEKYVRYTGKAHMKSLEYFKKKYGSEVEEWGKSDHWWPLPGIQVIIKIRRIKRDFESKMKNIEKDLNGFSWILVLEGNMNRNKLPPQIKDYIKKCGADRIFIKKLSAKEFNESENLKKRVIRRLSKEYPAIYPIDIEKKIKKDLIRKNLWKIRDEGKELINLKEEKFEEKTAYKENKKILNKSILNIKNLI